jgi:hypothetical protein
MKKELKNYLPKEIYIVESDVFTVFPNLVQKGYLLEIQEIVTENLDPPAHNKRTIYTIYIPGSRKLETLYADDRIFLDLDSLEEYLNKKAEDYYRLKQKTVKEMLDKLRGEAL